MRPAFASCPPALHSAVERIYRSTSSQAYHLFEGRRVGRLPGGAAGRRVGRLPAGRSAAHLLPVQQSRCTTTLPMLVPRDV